jgi:hypothetical protein
MTELLIQTIAHLECLNIPWTIGRREEPAPESPESVYPVSEIPFFASVGHDGSKFKTLAVSLEDAAVFCLNQLTVVVPQDTTKEPEPEKPV